MSDFYSQCGEDRWIAENVKLPTVGVFVEIGAADGRENSNTLYWEKLGWTGLVVEPDPRLFDLLINNRQCTTTNVAVGAKTGKADFPLHLRQTWSGFARTNCTTIEVSVETLADVLVNAKINHVDILSIDTEGTELNVWASRPKWLRPLVIIVEHETAELPSIKNDVLKQFKADGYSLVHETQYNFIFVPNQLGTLTAK